jgi:hypothetical protein
VNNPIIKAKKVQGMMCNKFRVNLAVEITETALQDNPKSSVPLDVAVAEKGLPFYENRQPLPQRKTWTGESVVLLDAAI